MKQFIYEIHDRRKKVWTKHDYGHEGPKETIVYVVRSKKDACKTMKTTRN